jgi:UDP-N-acetylmuramoyl-tripeptide--D-alanyl-D-alanine ligase
MHYRKRPTNKAYAFAAVAKAEGAELLYFSPKSVDFENRKIAGYVYRSGEWKTTVSDFPSVVCNVVGFESEEQARIAERLSEKVLFTSYSIGSKATVYKNIIKYKDFANYLVPTEALLSAKQLIEFIDRHGAAVIKPSSGCQGINVYFINRIRGAYIVATGAEKVDYDARQILEFIAERAREDYIIQPYINCRTKSGNSYDLRLHVQKTSAGRWVVGNIFPRIAEQGSIVCNLARGSYTGELTAFLKREFEEDYLDIKGSVEQFSLQLAAHMDMIQKELYDEELDELGIDIGLDKAKKIWVYEVNWRPGYPPSLNLDLGVLKNTIQYSIFLATKNKKERAHTYEGNSFYRNK